VALSERGDGGLWSARVHGHCKAVVVVVASPDAASTWVHATSMDGVAAGSTSNNLRAPRRRVCARTRSCRAAFGHSAKGFGVCQASAVAALRRIRERSFP